MEWLDPAVQKAAAAVLVIFMAAISYTVKRAAVRYLKSSMTEEGEL